MPRSVDAIKAPLYNGTVLIYPDHCAMKSWPYRCGVDISENDWVILGLDQSNVIVQKEVVVQKRWLFKQRGHKAGLQFNFIYKFNTFWKRKSAIFYGECDDHHVTSVE